MVRLVTSILVFSLYLFLLMPTRLCANTKGYKRERESEGKKNVTMRYIIHETPQTRLGCREWVDNNQLGMTVIRYSSKAFAYA